MNPQMPGLLIEKQKEIERERRKKQKENAANQYSKPSVNKLTQGKSERATQKIAEKIKTKIILLL